MGTQEVGLDTGEVMDPKATNAILMQWEWVQ